MEDACEGATPTVTATPTAIPPVDADTDVDHCNDRHPHSHD